MVLIHMPTPMSQKGVVAAEEAGVGGEGGEAGAVHHLPTVQVLQTWVQPLLQAVREVQVQAVF
jgi:hypothetical protein